MSQHQSGRCLGNLAGAELPPHHRTEGWKRDPYSFLSSCLGLWLLFTIHGAKRDEAGRGSPSPTELCFLLHLPLEPSSPLSHPLLFLEYSALKVTLIGLKHVVDMSPAPSSSVLARNPIPSHKPTPRYEQITTVSSLLSGWQITSHASGLAQEQNQRT
jgi:hypothetical protein